MTEITITENEYNQNNLLYLQTTLSELLTRADCQIKCSTMGKRYKFQLTCPDYYSDIIRAELIDKVAEIIAVNYKYQFFNNTIKVGGISRLELEILYAGLIAADIEEDKRYAFEKIKSMKEFAIDGIFNFRLQPLKRKWTDVVSYMPGCFLTSQLHDFISYLLENKRKRVYIDDGKVYDNHYRRLKRNLLIGGDKAKIIREVLISNCGEIEIKGEVPAEDEKYLKEFYGEKIFFRKVNGQNS